MEEEELFYYTNSTVTAVLGIKSGSTTYKTIPSPVQQNTDLETENWYQLPFQNFEHRIYDLLI